MICPFCGEKVDADTVICSRCGAKIPDSAVAQDSYDEHISSSDSGSFNVNTIPKEEPDKEYKGLNKTFFILSLTIGPIICMLAMIPAVLSNFSNDTYNLFLVILTAYTVLYCGIVICIFIYKIWQLIQGRGTDITPGQAVGFMFIPVFNIYWLVKVFWSFPNHYNRFVEAYYPGVPRISALVYKIIPIMGVIILITLLFSDFRMISVVFAYISILVLVILVSQTCDSVNILSGAGFVAGVLPRAASLKNTDKEIPFLNNLKLNHSKLALTVIATIIVVGLIVFAAYPRPRLVVDAFNVPEEAICGEEMVVTCSIANTGRSAGTHILALLLDENILETREIELAAGASETVRFSVRTEHPSGLYKISLGLGPKMKTSDELESSVRFYRPANIVASKLILSPAKMNIGEETKVSVTLSNTGEVKGSQAVDLKINGLIEQTKEVSVEGDKTTEISFSLTIDNPGPYNIEVDALSETLEVFQIERPSNGKIITNNVSGGYGQFKIINRLNEDGVVILARADNPTVPVLAVYVRSEGSTTVRGIRDGTYICFYSFGEDWDAYSKRFTKNPSYGRFENEEKFSTIHRSDGYTYSIYTVEFGARTATGSTKTTQVDPDQFPSF